MNTWLRSGLGGPPDDRPELAGRVDEVRPWRHG